MHRPTEPLTCARPRTLALALALALVPALAPAASFNITGTVRTALGTAVANADIDVIDACTGVNLFLPADHSAADGSFQVTVNAAGTYDVHVIPPAGNTFAAADVHDVVITTANVSVGTITLATARLVSGTVRTPVLGAAANVDLKFTNTSTGDRAFLTKTLTNALGQWSVRVPPGTWELDFRPPAGSPYADTERLGLVVGASDIAGLLDTLKTGFTVSGRVVDRNNNALRNVDLDLVDVCTGQTLANAHDNSDSLGNFSVVAPAGTYSLHLKPPLCKAVEALRVPDVVVSAAVSLGTRTMRDAFLVTGVVHNQNGTPMVDANLRAFDVGGVDIFQQGTTRDHTSATGSFALALPNGTFDINVEPPVGSNELVLHLNNVAVNGPKTLGTVTAGDGLPLSGHLGAPGGGGASNVALNVLDHETRAKLRLAHDQTDGLGNFRVVVPPGTYDVQYDPPVCDLLAPTSQDSIVVTAAKTLPALGLAVGSHLRGTITDTLGVATVDADLDVFPLGSGHKLYTPHDATLATGAFDLLLPPGTYDVQMNPTPAQPLCPQFLRNVNVLSTVTLPTTRLKNGHFLNVTVRRSGTLLPIEGVQLRVSRRFHSVPDFTIRDISDAAGLVRTVVQDSVFDLVFVPPAGSGLAQATRVNVPVHSDVTLADQILSPISLDVEPPALPAGLWLASPSPNPARGSVRFSLRAPDGEAELSVWDVTGRRVATIWHGRSAPTLGLDWDGDRDGGRRLPAGSYLVRLLDSTGALRLQRVTLLP
jgi:hypothetical protein